MKDTAKKEIYKQNLQETSISVVQTDIDSIRTKNITRTAVRLYDGQYLGVGGALGRTDEAELEQKAGASLAQKIPYPFDPLGGNDRSEKTEVNFNSGEEFIGEMRELLSTIRNHQPEFIFSGKLNLSHSDVTLKNDTGADYSYQGATADLGLMIKEKSSPNILDAGVECSGITYDRDAFVTVTNMICNGFKKEVDIYDGEYPVVFLSSDRLYQMMFLRSLHGLLYGSGTSLFSGKIGEKLFGESVTLYQSRSAGDEIYVPFFDFEGTVNQDDRCTLIENGVVKSPFTTRTYAAKFDLPRTGAAGGEYDSVPNIGFPNMVLADTGRTAAEILGGGEAILIVIASGGDFTPDGAFASPVQLGYLYDGKHLLGKIPSANVSSHVYKMFGDDFLGVSTNSVFPNRSDRAVVMKMKVEKSG